MNLHDLHDLRQRAAGNSDAQQRVEAAIDARIAFIGADSSQMGAARRRDADALAELERLHPELFGCTP